MSMSDLDVSQKAILNYIHTRLKCVERSVSEIEVNTRFTPHFYCLVAVLITLNDILVFSLTK